jgi:hypothetical protein
MHALNLFVLVPILISYALASQTNFTIPQCAVSRITLHMSGLSNDFSGDLYQECAFTLGLSGPQSSRLSMSQCRVTAKFLNVFIIEQQLQCHRAGW